LRAYKVRGLRGELRRIRPDRSGRRYYYLKQCAEYWERWNEALEIDWEGFYVPLGRGTKVVEQTVSLGKKL
jgi:hypothetical protein